MKAKQIFNVFDSKTEPSDDQLSELMNIVIDASKRKASIAHNKLFDALKTDAKLIASKTNESSSLKL